MRICASVDELVAGARETAVGAILLDPALYADAALQAHALSNARRHRLPIVLYTHDSPATSALCFKWARAGAGHLFLAAVDDDAARMRAVFGALLHGRIAAVLDECFMQLPVALARTLRGIFDDDDGAALDLDQLASSSNMTRRSVIRCLQRAQLAPPKRFLGAARLLRTHRILLAGEQNLAIAAMRAGFSSNRSLVLNARTLLEAGPATLRTLPSDELHQRVAKRLREA
ncbi:MAG: hypothetical protein M3Z05_09735 [Gemmatimonadota bacterium]|nr:hypothetical protein [Gemmatimonadota bacterium]